MNPYFASLFLQNKNIYDDDDDDENYIIKVIMIGTLICITFLIIASFF